MKMTQNRMRWFWIAAYLVMNIAAIAVWSAWYSHRADASDHSAAATAADDKAPCFFGRALRSLSFCSTANAVEFRSLSPTVMPPASPYHPRESVHDLLPSDEDRAFNSQSLQAVLLPDRSVYHGGETVALSGLVRDGEAETVANMQLDIVLVSDTGETVSQSAVLTDTAGRVKVETVLADDAPLGILLVEARIPGKTAAVGQTLVRIDPCQTMD